MTDKQMFETRVYIGCACVCWILIGVMVIVGYV